MRRAALFLLSSVPALVIACEGDSRMPTVARAEMDAFLTGSDWSPPIHLDAPINSEFGELGGSFSPDGMSMYFGSDRPGGPGGFDIFVTRRECGECPWTEPIRLGDNINSSGGDGFAAFSQDGRMLIFSSARAGGFGGEDLWLAWRDDPTDDLAWGSPINLGSDINTSANEQAPSLYFRAVGDGDAHLVFARSGVFYQATLDRGGNVVEAPSPIAEINDAASGPADTQFDGQEILVFSSTRSGGLGASDLWASTRRNGTNAWSAPVNLGPVLNTPLADLQPGLTRDGRTIVFAAGASARPSLGRQDLWISNRSP